LPAARKENDLRRRKEKQQRWPIKRILVKTGEGGLVLPFFD